MPDDVDNMLRPDRTNHEPLTDVHLHRALDKLRGDPVGLEIPFEFVCLSCASQGVRVVIPPDGSCSRCQPNALNRQPELPPAAAVPTISGAALLHREPIVGWYCIGGRTGFCVGVKHQPRRLHRWMMRALLGWEWFQGPEL